MGPIARCYGRFLARFYYLVILGSTAIVVALLAVAFIYGSSPDFSNPDFGFETRGTDLARRIITWRNLEEASKQAKILSTRPSGFRDEKSIEVGRITKRDASSGLNRNDHPYFCGEPGLDYARVVVGSISSRGLFNVDALKEICHFSRELSSSHAFQRTCQYSDSEETTCCPVWSLGSYIASIRSLPSCEMITENDVVVVRDLLLSCLPYFENGTLLVCSEGKCDGVPERCSKNNRVYDILYYLTDSGFLRTSDALRYSVLFLPVATSTQASDFYFETIDKKAFAGDLRHIQLVGAELGLKWWLFEHYLLLDTVICVGLATVAVFVCLWAYSGSFTLSFSTMTSGVMSLVVAYFFYTIAFSIDFFPYINLMAVALAIAVVADDSFILWSAWKANGNDDIGELVGEAVAESWLPCSVTSLTTAGALYSSYVSSITAVKCFSVFAGTAVVANLILTLTWLPAWLVLYETMRRKCCWKKGNEEQKSSAGKWTRFPAKMVDYFFQQILPGVLLTGRFVWTVIFGVIGALAVVVVTYYPGLRLPHTAEYQLFDMSHPFERYDFVLKKHLLFEEEERKFSASLPLRFVWGVKPVDFGSPMDPNDWGKGTMEIDEDFHMSDPAAQLFLLEFCQDIKQQSFYLETPGAISNCFIESFKNYFMGRDCVDQIEKVNLWPCCQDTRFPYKPKIFDNCIAEGVASLYEVQSKFYGSTPAGPKFLRGSHPPKIGVVVVEYSSVYNFTFDHREMAAFYDEVQKWFDEKLHEAPATMRDGFFVSDLEFFDLQRSLSVDTFLTVATDMGIAFVILLLSTFQVAVSIAAILTVFLIICCTVAALTLFGWTLNILESAIVTLAIGLAVDFALHYGIAFKTAPGRDRREKAEAAINAVGVPVSMGAMTTFLAGLAMLPSRVLAHVQIGIFLVVLTATSWALSTFFLVPLLAAFGYESPCCRKDDENESIPCELNSAADLDETFETYATLRPAIVPQSRAFVGKTTRV